MCSIIRKICASLLMLIGVFFVVLFGGIIYLGGQTGYREGCAWGFNKDDSTDAQNGDEPDASCYIPLITVPTGVLFITLSCLLFSMEEGRGQSFGDLCSSLFKKLCACSGCRTPAVWPLILDCECLPHGCRSGTCSHH